MLPDAAKMGSSWTQFDIWILLAMFTDAPQAISIFPDAIRMLHRNNPDEIRMFSDPTPQYLILINILYIPAPGLDRADQAEVGYPPISLSVKVVRGMSVVKWAACGGRGGEGN